MVNCTMPIENKIYLIFLKCNILYKRLDCLKCNISYERSESIKCNISYERF